MFIGHFAVGLASKRFAPRVSLGWLLAAPLFLDLIWPLFLLAGVERVALRPDAPTPFLRLDLHDYPWSHSLVMALVWSVLFALVGGRRHGRTAMLVLGAGVFSHFVLDFVTHRPDMPLFPGGATEIGLGLWNSTAGTIAVEVAMFAAGVWVYAHVTRRRDRTGAAALWGLVAFVLLVYVASVFGPPPPRADPIGKMALASWLFVPWAIWIDRHRQVVAGT